MCTLQNHLWSEYFNNKITTGTKRRKKTDINHLSINVKKKKKTDLFMMSEVGLTEWPRTVHTRLERLQLPPNAGITGHIPSLGKLPGVGARRAHVACIWAQIQCGSPWGNPGQHQPLELGGDFSQDPVDADLGFFGVALLAHGADELLAVVPVALQAGLAEAVATRRGDGLHEHLQTDGAAELLLREDSATRRAHACEKEEGNGRVIFRCVSRQAN